MNKILAALFLASSLWGYGEGMVYWTPHGCDEGKAVASKHGGHGKGESAMFALMNSDGNTSAHLVLPNLTSQPLSFKLNTVMLPKPPMGGYYAMIAEEKSTDRVYSAIRYLSLQGRPSKISPTKLTGLNKSVLEIVPDPLHREHDRYTASKSYRFLIRFHDQALADTTVSFETHNTPAQTLMSDENGKFTITLPNDFKNVQIGRSENKPSEFLLSVNHKEAETLFVTTLTMPYSLNPNDFWQSQPYGAGAVFLGFLGGIFLYRRHLKSGVSRG